MNDLNECFKVLGIKPDATQEEINRAFRKMSHAWHPDKFPAGELKTEAEEMQKQINNAYVRLRNYKSPGDHNANSRENERPSENNGCQEQQSGDQGTPPPKNDICTDSRTFTKHLHHDMIVAAIRAAEQKTSGEIRVFISHKKVDDAVAAAQAQFERLGMTQTRHRNGVLIFVAPTARKFAILGDVGVHQKCGDEFWRAVSAEMTGHFVKAEFTAGIIHGIQKAGELLAAHFPPQPGDANELPDQVEHD